MPDGQGTGRRPPPPPSQAVPPNTLSKHLPGILFCAQPVWAVATVGMLSQPPPSPSLPTAYLPPDPSWKGTLAGRPPLQLSLSQAPTPTPQFLMPSPTAACSQVFKLATLLSVPPPPNSLLHARKLILGWVNNRCSLNVC